jgi:aspartate/methionine/tyrosine aminotransferase
MSHPLFSSDTPSVFEEMTRLARSCEAINLGQGFPEAMEPPELIEAAVAALRVGPHQYPPMYGVPELRQAVAESNQRFYGLATDWEREVLVTVGATEALTACFLGLFRTGDEVILLQPAYDHYQRALRRAGAVPVPVRLEPPEWELPHDRLAAAITRRTRAIVLNSPMNPSGKVFGEEDLAFIAALLERHDLIAICDEAYEHLVFDGARHRPLMTLPGARERCLRIGSAGKTFSVTGWKIGYITAPHALLAPVAQAHQFITFTVAPALQLAVAHGLRLPDAYFDGLRSGLQARRDLLAGGLAAAGLNVLRCPATYFMCVDIADGDPAADDLVFGRAMAREAGVVAIPVSAFYAGRDMRHLLRFCFAKRPEVLEAVPLRQAS